MVKKLTKAAEDRLMTALNRVADLTNDGADPNEAISKVAMANQIPAGHVQLLVNAYNTGRTTAQRRSSDDLWSKVAEFPLADTSAILEKMFPDRVKTAGEIHREKVVSYEYEVSPGWVERMKAAETRSRKVDWKMVDPPKPYPTEKDEYRRVMAEIKRANDQSEEARYKVAAAFSYAVQAKNDLADFFKYAGCVPFQEVRTNAVMLYGDPAKALFDQLAQENPKFEKQSARTKAARAKGAVYDALADCMELTEAYTALKEDYQTKEAAAAARKEELLRPFAPGPKLDPVLGVPVPASVKSAPDTGSHSKEAQNNKPTGFFGGLAHGWGKAPTIIPHLDRGTVKDTPVPLGRFSSPINIAGWGLGRAIARSKMVTDTANEVRKKQLKDDLRSQYEPGPDMEHEQQLDALRQESNLSDLLSSDEILSHRDPHEVLEAYSNLRNLAPTMSGNKEMLRSYLRGRLEGQHTDMFGLKAIAETERIMRDLNPAPGGGGGGDDDKKD